MQLQASPSRRGAVHPHGAATLLLDARAASFVSPLAIARSLPGPRYVATYLLTVPVIVVAAASTGREQLVSGLIAASWLVLSPLAMTSRPAALLLPVTSSLFLLAGVLTLSFNSAAFVVDVAITAAMALVSFPRQRVEDQGAPSPARPAAG